MTSTLSSYSPTLSSNNNSILKNSDDTSSTSGSSSNSSSPSNDKFQVVAGSTPFFKVKDKSKVYKEATKQEIEFYEKLFNNTKSNNASNKLMSLVPKFYGLSTQRNKDYIILEDLTHGYKKPCIMDIKLGLSHHDVNLDHLLLSSGKTEYQDLQLQLQNLITRDNNKFYKSWLTSKYITTPLMGFCICGLQKYRVDRKDYDKRNKEHGRTLTQDTVTTQLQDFFNNGREFRLDIVQQIHQKLKQFKDFFESNPHYRFRSTSILFIYEGDNSSSNSEPIKSDIRLIDFTHTKEYPDFLKPYISNLSSKSNNENEPFFPVDGGYLYGISTLLDIIESLKQQSPKIN